MNRLNDIFYLLLYKILFIIMILSTIMLGETYIVSKSGGDYQTLSEAVAASSSGDTVLITDSETYEEGVLIEKDITIIGNSIAPPVFSSHI